MKKIEKTVAYYKELYNSIQSDYAIMFHSSDEVIDKVDDQVIDTTALIDIEEITKWYLSEAKKKTKIDEQKLCDAFQIKKTDLIKLGGYKKITDEIKYTYLSLVITKEDLRLIKAYYVEHKEYPPRIFLESQTSLTSTALKNINYIIQAPRSPKGSLLIFIYKYYEMVIETIDEESSEEGTTQE